MRVRHLCSYREVRQHPCWMKWLPWGHSDPVREPRKLIGSPSWALVQSSIGLLRNVYLSEKYSGSCLSQGFVVWWKSLSRVLVMPGCQRVLTVSPQAWALTCPAGHWTSCTHEENPAEKLLVFYLWVCGAPPSLTPRWDSISNTCTLRLFKICSVTVNVEGIISSKRMASRGCYKYKYIKSNRFLCCIACSTPPHRFAEYSISEIETSVWKIHPECFVSSL